MTTACAVFVGSATDVAVTVTACCELIDAGAVYNPLADSDPIAGFKDHVAETFALNCWVWFACKLTLNGLTLTLMVGFNVTTACADFAGSASDVAVTVTACCELIDAGAVYNPLAESVPAAGFIDHVTEVFVDPLTDALNCWVWFADRVTEVGLMLIETGFGAGEVEPQNVVCGVLPNSNAPISITPTLLRSCPHTGLRY